MKEVLDLVQLAAADARAAKFRLTRAIQITEESGLDTAKLRAARSTFEALADSLVGADQMIGPRSSSS